MEDDFDDDENDEEFFSDEEFFDDEDDIDNEDDDYDFDSVACANGMTHESSIPDQDTSLIQDESSNSKLVTSNSSNANVIKSDDQSNFKLINEVLNKADAYDLAKQLKFDTDSDIYYQNRDREELDNFFKVIERLNHAECESLVFAHNMYEKNSSANIETTELASKSQLLNILKSKRYPIKYLNHLMDFQTKNQLQDSLLKWLKEDLRNALHIAYLIRDTLCDKALVGDKELINYILKYLKYEVIRFNKTDIDFPNYANDVNYDEHQLIGKIEGVKTYYFRNRADREIKWLNGDDSNQIEWAYNYLSSEKRDYLLLQNIFIPSSLQDKYNLILASLDILSNVDYTYEALTQKIDISDPTIDLESISKISYRVKIIENMKDAWAKFSASNKNEDLSDVKIYKKNQDQLESIMKTKGTIAVNKVISQLIEDEYNRIFNKD